MIRRGIRRRPVFFIAMLLLAGLAVAAIQATDRRPSTVRGTVDSADPPYAEGEVLVKLKPGTTSGAAAMLAADMDAEERARVPPAVRSAPAPLPAAALGRAAAPRDLLAVLRSRPEVEAASPNYRRRLLRLPNDPKYARQWGMSEDPRPRGLGTERGLARGGPGRHRHRRRLPP